MVLPPARAGAVLAAALLVILSSQALPMQARAQGTAPATPPAAADESGAAERRARQAEEERARRQAEFEALQRELARAAEEKRRLDEEIAALRSDRAKLNNALIETTARIRATRARTEAIEERLTTLIGSEAAIRRSLESRRGTIAEVLAALQRMGRRPPPAVLVRPDDILEAVRTSMLLGAVVPELRAETRALAADLAELVRLREAIVADREALRKELADLGRESERLTALVDARQSRLAEIERDVGGERRRADELATQAAGLRDLIERMEADISSARRAADEARRAAEEQARATRERFAAAAFRDPARLAPKVPFSETRGLLPLPVSGTTVREFGAPDGYGGTARGISISTRPGEIVTSPADGWVAFAGPFRSYGRLLIINAGGGYYLLLAGMDQINVEVGQFVLAGEPVAVMGGGSSGAPGQPEAAELYVEFRKDGGSIDPGPWWQKTQGEKVRG